MATQVDVEIIVRQPNGAPIVQLRGQDLTFNIDVSRPEDEVPLAVGAIERIFRDQLAVAEGRLSDWAASIRKAIDRQEEIQKQTQMAAEQAMRETQDDDPPTAED